MSSSGKINHDTTEPFARLIAYTIILTAILLIITVQASSIYYSWTLSRELDRKEAGFVPYDLKELRTQEKAIFQSAKLPLESAMKDVVRSYQ